MKKKLIQGTIAYEYSTRGYSNDSDDIYDMTKSFGKMLLLDDNSDKETEIGTFSFYYIDLIFAETIHETFDRETQYLSDMAVDMLNKDMDDYNEDFNFMTEWGSLIVIDTINIKEEYRGYGIAKGLFQFFRKHYESATILLKAYPLQYSGQCEKHTQKEFNFALNKVIKAYKNCGLKLANKKLFYMYSEGGTRL